MDVLGANRALPYGERARTLQVDMMAYDEADKTIRAYEVNAAPPSRRGYWQLPAIRRCRHVVGEQKAPNWTKKSRPPSRIRRMIRKSCCRASSWSDGPRSRPAPCTCRT